ncbi:hypothetical protein BOTBODRAFT_188338 [Botryobasidium botryosum FD-172 SS1]|uniref:Aminoglycoside phosphotransferase domain-containing protein n=1 Tax=Botryobasidium botryosum (strain FD-172 SS1) TaxID=930990 RepID=A0A067MDF7_BOTB1|nr:hypothetical protein BOTBODRAFT_188338 [Botryobasidium botryosum FD-172 SS1]
MNFSSLRAYLASSLSLSAHRIKIQPLAGGFCNTTVRASFSPPIYMPQLGFLGSIIVKYALPHAAPSDPTHHHQIVEARALALLDPRSPDPLAISALALKCSSIKIPRLVFHDAERRVLAMTDLGDALPLDDWLTSDPPPPDCEVQHTAAALGRFLAEFAVGTSNPSAQTLARASNAVLMDAWYADVIRLMRTVLARARIDDADVLVARAHRSLQEIGEVESCLGMVDLWTGNVLVDSQGNCGLIDWECFGLSSASCELSMFIASLYRIFLRTTSKDTLRRTGSFTRALLRSYGLHAPTPSLYFKRQALLAHGRSLINHVGFYEKELSEEMKDRALSAGLACMRAAGESEHGIRSSFFHDDLADYESLYESSRLMLLSGRL